VDRRDERSNRRTRDSPIAHPSADVLAFMVTVTPWPGLEQTGNSSEDPGDPECPVYRRRFSEATPDVSQHPELRPWAMPATRSIPNDENEFPRVTPEHGGYDRLLYLPSIP
jgi:hypothetical protein